MKVFIFISERYKRTNYILHYEIIFYFYFTFIFYFICNYQNFFLVLPNIKQRDMKSINDYTEAELADMDIWQDSNRGFIDNEDEDVELDYYMYREDGE